MPVKYGGGYSQAVWLWVSLSIWARRSMYAKKKKKLKLKKKKNVRVQSASRPRPSASARVRRIHKACTSVFVAVTTQICLLQRFYCQQSVPTGGRSDSLIGALFPDINNHSLTLYTLNHNTISLCSKYTNTDCFIQKLNHQLPEHMSGPALVTKTAGLHSLAYRARSPWQLRPDMTSLETNWSGATYYM